MRTPFSDARTTCSGGNLWFTNVSPRTGSLCVVAQAKDPDLTIKTAESIPACADVGAYASVHLQFTFASSDLSAACPKANCKLTYAEAPEGHD